MVKFLIVGVLVALVVFAWMNYNRVQETVSGKKPAGSARAVEPEVVAHSSKGSEYPFVLTDPQIVGLSNDEDSFVAGEPSSHGMVSAVQDGVVRFDHGKKSSYLRTKAAVPTREVVVVVGRISDAKGVLECIMVKGGEVLRMGSAYGGGRIVEVTKSWLRAIRADGGDHYLIVAGEDEVAKDVIRGKRNNPDDEIVPRGTGKEGKTKG